MIRVHPMSRRSVTEICNYRAARNSQQKMLRLCAASGQAANRARDATQFYIQVLFVGCIYEHVSAS